MCCYANGRNECLELKFLSFKLNRAVCTTVNNKVGSVLLVIIITLALFLVQLPYPRKLVAAMTLGLFVGHMFSIASYG